MPDSQTNISPLILQKLGLSTQMIQKIREEKREREQATAISKKNGSDTYDALYNNPGNPLTSIHLASGSFDISPVHSPQELLQTVKVRLKDLSVDAKNPDLIPQLKAFIDGFGAKALEKKDYLSAIPCLDFASKNGILNNDEVIAKIKAITMNDPEELLKVAEIIESTKEVMPSQEPAAESASAQTDNTTPSLFKESAPDQEAQTPNGPYTLSHTNGQPLRPVPPPVGSDDSLF